MGRDHSRRTALRTLGIGGVAILAGCLGDDDDAGAGDDHEDDGDGHDDDDGDDDDHDEDHDDDDGDGHDDDDGYDHDHDEDHDDDDGYDDDHDDEEEAVHDATGETHVEVTVAPGGDHTFEPAAVRIDPGTTVRWHWDAGDHNVSPASMPDGADWDGHTDLEGEGHEYEFTFEVTGTYEYVCEPHSVQMIGEIHLEGEHDDDGDDDSYDDDGGGY